MKLLKPTIAFVLLVVVAQAALARKWTDSSGTNSVEAEFVELVDGNVVLRKSDGKTISLPLTKLSLVDQAHVRQISTPKEDEPAEVKLRVMEARYNELLAAHRESTALNAAQQTDLNEARDQINVLRQELKAATSNSIKDQTVRACEEALHIAPLIVQLESRIEALNVQSQRVTTRHEEKKRAGEPTDAEEREVASLESVLMAQKSQLEKLASKVPNDPVILSMYETQRKLAIQNNRKVDQLVELVSQLQLENQRLKQAQGILPE